MAIRNNEENGMNTVRWIALSAHVDFSFSEFRGRVQSGDS